MISFWREHLEREPDLKPYLERLARKYVRTGIAPRTFTFDTGSGQMPIRRALEFLFGGGRRTGDKLAVQLPERLRTDDALRALADLLGVASNETLCTKRETALATALLRQKLIHPGCAALLDAISGTDELVRLFRRQEQAEAALDGLLRAVEHLRDNRSPITLSQLGADALQDSKALRTGALRNLLVTLLATLDGTEDEDSAQVLARFGVIDNPYTTLALLYGPVAYVDASGNVWDWPAHLHAAGQVAALTWAQVQEMRAIRLTAPSPGVITSENAAPFHRLVERRESAVCVYTEGYPNSAVMHVLSLLAQAGLCARHWGDTDLDGLRITACVARAIPTERVRENEAACAGQSIPLDDAQRKRAAAYLATHPDFIYRDALTDTLRHGWREQEQSRLP